MDSVAEPPRELRAAIDIFVGGVAFTRSRTHPYLVENVGPLVLMRDAPRKRGNPRIEEWIAFGVEPSEVDALVRAHARGRFAICAIAADAAAGKRNAASFKSLGYRLLATEPVFVHDLRDIPAFASPATVERVTTPQRAAELGKLIRRRPLGPESFGADSPLRQYVALVDGMIVGRVASIATPSGAWCADMVVAEPHRRRGIARSLLSTLLADARNAGAERAALTSSHTGALLYPMLGYRQVGTLYLLMPKRG